MESIKVFGHTAPDTDTVGSAILWAWYLNAHTSNDAQAYMLGESNKETAFVLNRWEVSQPELLETVSAADTVAIVDTNNPDELFNTINEATITTIIDHHRLSGGLQTLSPLEITMRPLASTASVIYDLIQEHVDDMPDAMKGVMLSCILSDTLAFRSPTTTPHDKDIAEKLASDLGVDVYAYADEMFAAKSDVSDFSDSGLIQLDSKKFEVDGKNFRISVIETTKPDEILARKSGIIAAITQTVSDEHDVDDVVFFIVDILKEEATVLVHSELVKQLIETSFGVSVEGDTEVLPGIVSRKKQIVPVLKL